MKFQLKKQNPIQKTFTITCFILGLFLVLAIKAQINSNNYDTSNKNQDLVDVISALEEDNATLEDQISIALKEIESLTGNSLSNLNAIEEQNQQMREKSGQTELKGAGITITLDDNVVGSEMAKNSPGYNAEDYIVHDKNLLYLVNNLRSVAKGMSINGQRIVASSDIRCVGTVIMVNQSRLAPPYNIQILGDSSLLEETLKNSSEYKYIKNKKLKISYNKTTDMTLPAFTGTIKTVYAKIHEEGE